MEQSKTAMIFGFGLLTGGAISYFVLNKKFEALVQEEINSIHETRRKNMQEEVDTDEEALEFEEEDKKETYDAVLDKKNYMTKDEHFDYSKPSLEEMKRPSAVKTFTGKQVIVEEPTLPELMQQRKEMGMAYEIDGEHYPANDNAPTEDDISEDVDELAEAYEEVMKRKKESDPVNKREMPPYIISDEEFNEGEPDYDKLSLTYYEEDDVLADEREEFIPDSYGVIGDQDVLQEFGYLSGDNNVVYVRNHRLAADLEIVRVEGSYAENVVGLSPGLHIDPNKDGSA